MNQNTQKPVEAVILPAATIQAVLDYFGKKPFAEVAPLVNAIQVNSIGATEKELIDAGFLKVKTQEEPTGAVKEVIEPSNVKHMVEK